MDTLHRATSDSLSLSLLSLGRNETVSNSDSNFDTSSDLHTAPELIPRPEQILTRSLSAATIISWMFHHMPIPLMCREELMVSALFMDLGLLARLRNRKRRRIGPIESSTNSLMVRDESGTAAFHEWNERHPEYSAALISSVAGMPSSVRRIIRHHHACLLNGTEFRGSTTPAAIFMPERLLAAVVRALELLEDRESRISPSRQVNKAGGTVRFAAVATSLVNETILGKWDATFVNLVLSALSQALSFKKPARASSASTTAKKYRIDIAARHVNRPHIPVTNFVEPSASLPFETSSEHQRTTSQQLAGPHYLLSEQRKIIREKIGGRNLKQD
ncbi:MAG: hypothetical protein ACKVT0_09260 [Planctomycetaceae bacterium]